ncbi:sulfite exporter TauE/SafE family protein [Vibrio ostreicida]|uniref:Probable membrane transporter protein n=1 Tax=Vibrio ostreicida TaxID=526588 RepID=A0ABT8BYU0_9VIBR|nr:sulfite exporter TauE/SafE family protein [Vibrio ostreicida]MDN3611541.1 sulfite exporter TauE/SafE family protein [Vibrio ostreicida]NPD09035.1 sulfite exporter TauE/SafE family protein [Vibrio ostreicida]
MSIEFLYAGLAGLAFVTSLITAVVGMGGGVLLLAVLPSFIPPYALIPVHGAVQLSSNVSRFIFDIRSTCFTALGQFFIGSMIGAYFGAQLFNDIDFSIIPLLVSAFILFVLWFPIEKVMSKIPGKYFSLGIVQTSLALYVGATGPLSTSILIRDGYEPRVVIVTNAAINTLINVFKIAVFIYLGFVFHDFVFHVIIMSIFAIIGSYVGTKLRIGIDIIFARKVLIGIITIICLNNILIYFLE